MRQYNKSESGCETMGIDIEQTRQYYTEIKTEDLCDCDYCKNYYLQVKEAYPLVADYLNELGVDIEKPFEISPLEPVNGMLEYCVSHCASFWCVTLGWKPKGSIFSR